jgi:chemotaxis protein CheX
MRVEHINPFVTSASNIMEQVARVKTERGEISLRPRMFPSPDVSVILGVTGDAKGQVIYGLSQESALDIAKRMMMGLEVKEFDEVARSAIGELGNMITGNASSMLEKEGIITNISPPAIVTGENVSVSSPDGPILVVPLKWEDFALEINVFLVDNKKK